MFEVYIYMTCRLMMMIMTSGWGLHHTPTSPITKKYSTLKIKIDNKAMQKLHRSKVKTTNK